MTSRPASNGGIACAWIGVGVSMPCLASARAVALCAPSWTNGDETLTSALAPAWGAANEVRRDKLVDTRIPFRRSDHTDRIRVTLKKVHRAIGRSEPSHEADWGRHTC